MWTTLAFMAAMSVAPAQQGQLQLANPRVTYGVLGPKRPDNKILQGETFFLAFDILNLQTAADGKIQYGIGMQVINPTKGGPPEFTRDPPKDPQEIFNVLGGNTIPASASAVAGQTIYLNFSTLGAKLDNQMKPNLALSIGILDDTGKPTTQQPVTENFTQAVPANTAKIPLSFPLPLNRAGRFTVEL